MWTSFHHLSENISVESHTYCCHFCNCIAAIHHMLTPTLACFFPVLKILRNLILRLALLNFSYIPKITPFCIKRWRIRSHCTIRASKSINYLLMNSCLLGELRGSSYLIVILRKHIRHRSISIKLLRSFVEEFLEHIKEIIALLCVDSRILNDQTSISTQGLSYSLTIFRIISRFSKKVFDIDNGDRVCCTETRSESMQCQH